MYDEAPPREQGDEISGRERSPIGPKEGRPIAPAGEAHPAVAAADAPAKRSGAKRVVLVMIALAVFGAVGFFGYRWWTEGRFMISTDDAYVGADIAIVSPKITGYVETVPARENDAVHAGEPIATIDPGDLQLALDAAEAKIATQQAAIERFASQRAAAEAAVTQARSEQEKAQTLLTQAEDDLVRAERLASRGAGTSAQRDAARTARDAAASTLAEARAAIDAATAQVSVLDAQRAEAEGALAELGVARDQAERDLTFTVLRAPSDGRVGNLAVQVGDLVSPGKRLAAIVPADSAYVDANFKETQLDGIVPGQSAEIEVDALPGRTLTGSVESVAPASGSVFSLLPPDNATGNFTKVVQRVPVRIRIDDAQALGGALRPGLSVEVAIDRRTTPEAGSDAAPEAPDAAAAAAPADR